MLIRGPEQNEFLIFGGLDTDNKIYDDCFSLFLDHTDSEFGLYKKHDFKLPVYDRIYFNQVSKLGNNEYLPEFQNRIAVLGRHALHIWDTVHQQWESKADLGYVNILKLIH